MTKTPLPSTELKRKDTPERREYWEFVERTSLQVRANPEYHRGCPSGARGPKQCNIAEGQCADVMETARKEMVERYGESCRVEVTRYV